MRNFFDRLIVIKNDLDVKLGFMNWLFYNLIILINTKTPYKNLDKALLFSRN